MQLKAIKISGFKSFAEKTNIELQSGVTIVVGPNGSGKSNIAEAIRWVLGEQSAKTLRGQKMTDVIFSGAQNKQAMNMAKVSLVFDNSDHYLDIAYSELEVTRKLFRNGESWYGINGQECRLKDINALFMDSGMGPDSFSIISQGNVEEIFNSTPESRRSIVETLAGISQYKQQKKIANGKITSTQDNLIRVSDIIFELDNRLPELEKQRDIASDYLEQKNKLTNLKEQKALSTFHRLTGSVKQLTDQLANLKQAARSLEQTRQSLEQSVKANRLAMADQQELTKQHATKVQSLIQSENETLSAAKLAEQEKLYQKQALSETAEQKKEAQDQLQKLNERDEENEQNIQEAHTQLKQIQQAERDLQRQLAELNPNGEQLLADLQEQYVTLIQRQATVASQKKDQERLTTQQQEELAALTAQRTTTIAEQSRLEHQKNELNIQTQKQRQRQQRNAERQDALKTSIAKLEAQYVQQQSDWLSQLKQTETLKGQLGYQSQQQQNYQDYYQGVANLMQHRSQLKGIAGPVADFIETDSKYVTAIETALGGRLQQVIVDTSQSAKEAVNWLTQNKMGRVTFLPVDTIRAANQRVINESIRQLPGFVGSALELMEMPEQFGNVKSFLLANTLISTDLTSAISISRQSNQRFKVVSLDGQVVNPGGSITGGATKRQSNHLLTSKQRYQELKQELQRENKVVAAGEAALKAVQDQITTAKRDSEEAAHSELVFNQQLSQLAERIAANTTAANQLKRDLAENEEQQSNLTARLKVVNEHPESLEQLAKEINTVQDQIVQQKRDNEQNNKHKAQLTDELTVSKQSQAKLQSQVDFATQNQVALKRQLTDVHNKISVLDQQLSQYNQMAEEDKKQRLQTQLAQLKHEHQVEQQLQEQSESERRRLTEQLQSQTDQLNQTKLNQVETTNELSHLLEKQTQEQHKLRQSRSILLDQFGYLADELSDLGADRVSADVDAQITLLEKGINELGPVNVSAIEEYQKVADRQQFLTSQKADLETAIGELKRTIEEMDQESATRFTKTFTELAAAFERVFSQMFDGGKAKLVLTDPDHPLTTGVDIMAMPPGKKFRSMTLLSGGERSLTAISLLFAILVVRPVPFVILDETEAALDPLNVERFAKYIQQFSKDTQFIVITHRKETMVFGDRLYGITMQNSGVSKVVSVTMQANNEVNNNGTI